MTIFDENSKLVTHLGDNPDESRRAKNNIPRSEWVDGHFISPCDACWDAERNIIVGEWLDDEERLTMLRKDRFTGDGGNNRN